MSFFFVKMERRESIAQIRHQKDHILRSSYVPAFGNPITTARRNRMHTAIDPPFSPFLVTMDTIPATNMRIATIRPALPLISFEL